MGKEIKVVCGLIYDDEFHARTGGTRFYHLNGDIETNADGEQVYVCTKQNQQGKFEDIYLLLFSGLLSFMLKMPARTEM